jgi:hypothetical protein
LQLGFQMLIEIAQARTKVELLGVIDAILMNDVEKFLQRYSNETKVNHFLHFACNSKYIVCCKF